MLDRLCLPHLGGATCIVIPYSSILTIAIYDTLNTHWPRQYPLRSTICKCVGNVVAVL